jgi:hypothetical protein
MSSVVLDEELDDDIGEDEVDEAAVSEPEFPQAARLSGRARLRAAMVLRRASRMMWLLGVDCLTPGIRTCPRGGLDDAKVFLAERNSSSQTSPWPDHGAAAGP